MNQRDMHLTDATADAAWMNPGELFRDGRIHSDAYTSQAIFDLEMARIFHRTWLYIGHESEVGQQGDYRTRMMGRQPVIMVRGSDNVVRVLMNRCRHRGAVVCEHSRGNTSHFRCWFHGWVYETTGRLAHVETPEAYGDREFSYEDHSLTPAARVDNYRGLVFASLSPAGPSLLEHLGPATVMIDVAIDASPDGKITVDQGVHRTTFRGNWKMVGMDGYHPNILHASVWQILAKRANKSFRDTYSDSDKAVRTRAFLNGHVMLDNMQQRLSGLDKRLGDLKKMPGGEDYIAAMRSAYEPDRAEALIASAGDPHLGLFPNVQLIGNHIRVIQPIEPGLTQVDFYPTRLVGVSDEINEQRLRQHEFFYGPAGTVSPDDAEIFERAQNGMKASYTPWIDLRRGMGLEERDPKGSISGGITYELTQRGQLEAWKALMAQA